jgi:hypothetical protein
VAGIEPEDACHSTLENKGSAASHERLAADWQRSNCHFPSVPDCDLQAIRELHFLHFLWPRLPAETRNQLLSEIGRMSRSIRNV